MGELHRLNGGCRVRDAPGDPTGGLCLGLYPGRHLQESDLTDPFGTLRSHAWEFLLPDRWNPDTKGFPSHKMTLFLAFSHSCPESSFLGGCWSTSPANTYSDP